MKIDSNKLDSPIHYVCFDCGNNADKRNPIPESGGTTVHNGICDVCKDMRPIAHVRNFGFPIFEVEEV